MGYDPHILFQNLAIAFANVILLLYAVLEFSDCNRYGIQLVHMQNSHSELIDCTRYIILPLYIIVSELSDCIRYVSFPIIYSSRKSLSKCAHGP